MRWTSTLALLLVAAAAQAASPSGLTKETIDSGGNKFACAIYAPAKVTSGAPLPLLLLFHGSGRDGMSQINEWRKLADSEGIVLAAPTALNPRYWAIADETPELFRDITAFVAGRYPIDKRRIYAFGHSAGASFMLNMAPLESRFFAAVAVHAGAFPTAATSGLLAFAQRKIPLFIVVGTKDQFFSLDDVRKTRDAFAGAGFPIELHEILNHDHDYYGRSREINAMVWAFLSPKHLDADAQFSAYKIEKVGASVSIVPTDR